MGLMWRERASRQVVASCGLHGGKALGMISSRSLTRSPAAPKREREGGKGEIERKQAVLQLSASNQFNRTQLYSAARLSLSIGDRISATFSALCSIQCKTRLHRAVNPNLACVLTLALLRPAYINTCSLAVLAC